MRHPHLQAGPVWKTPSLLNSHMLSQVKVMLECDVVAYRLGREVTNMERAAAEFPFSGQHASEPASGRIVKSPLSPGSGREEEVH